jgi:hypothetical protein
VVKRDFYAAANTISAEHQVNSAAKFVRNQFTYEAGAKSRSSGCPYNRTTSLSPRE